MHAKIRATGGASLAAKTVVLSPKMFSLKQVGRILSIGVFFLAAARSSAFHVSRTASLSEWSRISRIPSTHVIPKHTSVKSVEGDFDADAIDRARNEVEAGSLKARLRALYKFTRPHTIRGTILASVAGTTRALIDTPGAIYSANWAAMIPRAIMGMVALLLGNAFIVGINQVYDEDIDKLNKPFLPVASGEMSKRVAWIAVISSGVAGPIIV